MQAMTGRRSAMLGVLLLGFGGVVMTGGCGSSGSGPPDSCLTPPDPPADTPADCPAPMGDQCMRYRIPLDGNPSTDVALRDRYIAAFGSACYMSEASAFNCFYKEWKAACADAVKIAEVYGAAPFDKGYKCQAVGNGDYTLQVGPDVANEITIYYEAAPRQTPLIETNGMPTEVNGPYRNLTEPQKLGPGEDFYCSSGMVDDDGEPLNQKEWILQVNRKKHGQIHSDLAGFEYPCGVDEKCEPKICKEPLVLKDPADDDTSKKDPEAAQVHHVVRRNDKRGCPWGTNSNKNAAVISRKLNRFLWHNYPSENEVVAINKVPPYVP